MKKLITVVAALTAFSVFSATQTSKEYVDEGDSLTLTNAITYTNIKVAEVENKIPASDSFLPAGWTNGTSIVIGNGSSASGGVNTVIGSGSVVQGVGASSFGEMCRAIGEHAIAWGSARALGDYCVAMGLNAEASAAYAIAIGQESHSLHQYSFAVGTEAVSSNFNSFAVGNKSKSLGQDSMAIGNRAQAFDYNSTAIGLDASAKGWNSLSLGSGSVASGLSSLSAGAGSEAYGLYSTAIGMGACASNSSAVAIGYNTKAYNINSVVIGGNAKSKGTGALSMGASTESAQNSVAIGNGAKATGEQSVAIGRDAKATHTGSVAIGPLAETTADGTMRIKYGIDEILLGFWSPKSLGDYIREMAPEPDESLIRSLAKDEVSKADHMPTKWYTVRGGVTQEVVEIRATVGSIGGNKRTVSMYFEPQTDDDMLSMQMKDGTLVTFQSGSGVSVQDGAKITLGKPDRLLVNGSTNLEQYVQAAKPADYETVKAKANGAAPQSTTYTKNETDSLIAANKPEYEDLASNVVWRIEADGARFFFKPVRPVHTED